MDCSKLRSFEGFENVNDEEATEIIEQLEHLANILYKHAKNEGLISIPTIYD